MSPDGTRLVFREETATTGADLMVLALEGGRPSARSASSGSTVSGVEPSARSGRGEPVEPRGAQPPSPGVGGPGRSATSGVRPLVQTTFEELNGEISPDGRWVVYQSNESGRDEIYVRPFPDANRGRWQISTGGGTRPLWARSGKELFYLGPSGAMMSASVEGGSTFRAGTSTRLFEGSYVLATNPSGRTYDVSPDGQRFLMVKAAGASDKTSAPTSLIVVEHWFEELKRLVPTN